MANTSQLHKTAGGLKKGSANLIYRGLRNGNFKVPQPFAHIYRIFHTDFTTVGTTHTITLATTFPKNIITQGYIKLVKAYCNVVAPMVAASMTACTFDLGDAGTGDGLIAAADADVVPASAGDILSTDAGAYQNEIKENAALLLLATATGANLSTTTAGEFVIVVEYSIVPPFLTGRDHR